MLRSGNTVDGSDALLPDLGPPRIVGKLQMGITEIDSEGRVTLNKRNIPAQVRGRYPFVEGAISLDGLPQGPASVPTSQPLAIADFLEQTVRVEMLHRDDLVLVKG